MMNKDDVTLSVVRALWGNVPPCLRSVSFELNGKKLKFLCLLDSDATEDDMELLSIAGTEIVADLPPEWEFEELIEKRAFPKELNNLENLVFLRHENQ